MRTTPRGTTGASAPGSAIREKRGAGRAGWAGAVAALAVAALAVTSAASPARADQTEQVPTGYSVQVAVRFSGDAAPGGSGGSTRTVTVKAACYWTHAEGPYTDAKSMLAWYDQVTHGLQTRGMLDQYGPRSVWEAAAEAEAGGQDLSWYRVFCQDPADYKDYNGGVADWVDPITGTPVGWVTFLYRAFPAGAAFPPPMVEPAELARVAHDLMVIPQPQIDRNPKINAPGAPTLVGLPTWFWVTNPASVGGANGTRTIRAELGNVWAQVVATTGGLSLASPAGSTTCAPRRAAVEYGRTVPQSSGCTVEFSKASVRYPRGFPVTATTDWRAAWTGSGGTGGGLDPLQRQATVDVPVAEVQNVVTP
jgi:hypothetical protein